MSAAVLVFVSLPPRQAAASPAAENDTSLPPAVPEHPLALTVIEELAALGVQGAWYWSHSKYWSNGGQNVTLHHFLSNFVSPDDIVLDADHFNTNGVGHPLAGAVSYQIARGNGMSVEASLVASVLSSFVWKFFGEWDQRPSTNDLIMTPAAGWVIGEATYRLGRVFAEGKPGVFNCLGTAVLSPFATLNGSTVCGFREGDRSPLVSRPQTWHLFGAEIGTANAVFDDGETRNESVLGLGGLLRANALYRRPGAGVAGAGPGQWSAARARWLIGDGALRGSSFDADTLVAGRYIRRYGDTYGASGEPDGWGVLVGLSSTFDYEARQLATTFDRTAAAGLLGPSFELSARRGPFALRTWLCVTYGFAQVTSLAYAQAAPAFADVHVKRVLQTMGYYYAHGPLSSAAIELEGGPLRLAFEGRAATFWSLDADYDGQSHIDDNFSLHDTRVFARAIASVDPLNGPLRLALELDDDRRDSQIPGTLVRSNERRIVASLTLLSR
jgi:hypothetical protein